MEKVEIKIRTKNLKYKKKSKIIYIIILSLISLYILKQNYMINLKNRNNLFNSLNNNITKIIENVNNSLFIDYIKACKALKIFNNRVKIKNKYPFLSICICVYNSEKYIKNAVLSIINQSFQDFEIIIINDFSKDNTYDIIMKLKKEDNRIIIINHKKNYGTYYSRTEGALNSRGKYILFVDPDDLIINPYLFEALYYYYNNFNLDIIEFTVYHQIEEKNLIYYPQEHKHNHYHNFSNKIIYQPDLSDIIFYQPRTKNYSTVICRTIWNKLYKREVMLKTINYIGNDYYKNKYIIVVEDTLLNVINFHFAENYTNINIPGYLYNIRQFSITRLKTTKEYFIKKSISFFLYYQLLFRYIKEFNKDRNFFFYEFQFFGDELIKLKKYNITNYSQNASIMFKEIMNDNKSSSELKKYIKEYYKLFSF